MAQRELPENDPLLVLLRDSLGDFRSTILRQRHGLARFGAELGGRAPAYAVVHDAREAAIVERTGYRSYSRPKRALPPGVAICKDSAALDTAIQRMASGNARIFKEAQCCKRT